MGLETAVVTSLVLGGASAAMGAFQATEQNKAIKRTAESRQRAAELQAEQLGEQAEAAGGKLRRRAEQVEGRLRVASADSGAQFSGTFENLAFQSDIGTGRNISVVDRNLAVQRSALGAGLDVQLSELGRQMQNPLIHAIMSGVQGASTGLTLGAKIP